MYKKCKKIVASMLVMLIMLTNLNGIGIHIGEVIAADLNNQNSKTKNQNVEMDTYFLEEEHRKTYEATKNIGEENKIIAQITVKNSGYLKNAKIKFEETNFNILETINSEFISHVDKQNNEIILKQIDAGESVRIEIPIEFKRAENYNPKQFSIVNKSTISGTYVDNKANQNEIEKELFLSLNWNTISEAYVEANISKFVPFDINEQKGLIMQTIITSGVKENSAPIKNTELEIEIPNINNIPPKDIKVNANSMLATRGEENGESFNESNYEIKDGIITINTQNIKDENENISWNKQGQDEYVVTYIYPEEALNSEQTSLNIKVNSNITLYNANETILQANNESAIEIQEKIGNIVDFEVEMTESLSKGQIYANYISAEKQEIIYNEKITANVGLASLIDQIVIEQKADTFISEKVQGSTTYANQNYAYYKNINISKENLMKILGEEGYIKIYSGSTEILAIDTNMQANENGMLELNISELDINNIKIQTSKPQTEGKLEISLQKAIKTDIGYNKNQISNFEKINANLKMIASLNGEILVEQNVEANTSLVEPQTKIELTSNMKDLSTIVKNENIEIRAILNTASNYNKLYTNPKIILEFPSYVEQIDVKNIELLYEDELIKEKEELKVAPDGTKILEISLKGTKTKYSKDTITGGTNILITADITTNNLTPSKEDTITMTVINENEQTKTNMNINFVAPIGIVTVNKVSNYAEGKEITALTSNEEATLEVQEQAKNAVSEIQVINNYSNPIKNVKILGRTLAQGTTNTENISENLNNTLNIPMINAIQSANGENVNIYYSENGNANKDINNPENAWKQEVADFSSVKSYLIELNDNESMNVGDSIKFTYDMQVPENLNYSQTASSLYTVYFDNEQEEQILEDRATSRMVTLSTGVAPELKVTLNSAVQENSIVRDGQYIRFIAEIENIGTVDAENTKLNITAPSGESEIGSYKVLHTEYKEEDFFNGYDDSEEPLKIINIGKVKVGQKVKVEFDVKIESVEIDSEENTEILIPMLAKVIADDMQKEVNSNEYVLKAEKADIALIVKHDMTTDSILIKDDELLYTAKVEQKNNQSSLKNVKVKIQIPNGLEIEEAKVENLVTLEEEIVANINIDKNSNVVEFTIEELYTGSEINCNVKTKVVNAIGEISPVVTAVVNDKEYVGNTVKNTVSKLNFTITQSKLDNPYVKEGEQITFEYIVTNTSNVYTNDFTFENTVPKGMKIVDVETIMGGESVKIKNYDEEKLVINRTFKEGQTVKFKVTMQAELLQNGEKQKEIENYASIYAQGFDKIESNKVKAIIEYNEEAYRGEEQNPNDPNNPVVDNKKIISGLAWLDENSNGERDDNEKILPGIEVRLLNKKTNKVIKADATSSNGEYEFTGVDEGEYLVVFVYDTEVYKLTEYKKNNVSQSTNSDFINVTMEIAGKEQTVAVSDTIKITNSNARNIDIGLIELDKSDMKLDKYISTVTVTYGNTVKTYNYNNLKVAKVEIPAKELKNATVIVEYKIVVTNEGSIANYVKKVVDYTPKDMKFNSELNRDWYAASNGDLYNSSLANTKIEAGQSKELSLTLTKKMTENNVGIVNNNAEIYEVYNEEGKQDIDSVAGNKVSGEDDISSADLVISVKTGDAIIYTLIISSLICATVAVSIYYIRKIVLRRM